MSRSPWLANSYPVVVRKEKTAAEESNSVDLDGLKPVEIWHTELALNIIAELLNVNSESKNLKSEGFKLRSLYDDSMAPRRRSGESESSITRTWPW